MSESDGHEEGPGLWEQQVSELARQVSAWSGNDAGVVEYTDDELRAAARGSEPLLDDVSRQGLTVAGTRTWFNEQLRPICKAAPTRRR